MKAKFVNKETNKVKEVDLGFCYMFYPFFLSSFLILPFIIYAIYREQQLELLTTFIMLFMVLPLLMYLGILVPALGILTIYIAVPVFLFYTLFLVPKNLNRWKINKLLKNGFEFADNQSDIIVSKFEAEMSNDSYVSNLFYKKEEM